jgi:hypothetical protein
MTASGTMTVDSSQLLRRANALPIRRADPSPRWAHGPRFCLVRDSIARPACPLNREWRYTNRRGKDGKDWRSLVFARAFASAEIPLNHRFRRTETNGCERCSESTSWGSLVRAQYRPSPSCSMFWGSRGPPPFLRPKCGRSVCEDSRMPRLAEIVAGATIRSGWRHVDETETARTGGWQ